MSPSPESIDTSGVTPYEGLHDLIGVLARFAHDQWVRQRRAEGWAHGPSPDDGRKEHPLLVPYDQLPEVERTRGRVTAADLVRVILALGYRIEKPPWPAASSPGAPDEETARVLRRLRDPDPMDLAALLAIWEARQPDRWAGAPEIYRLLGERILRVGEPLLAHDVLATGLEVWPQDVRLRQLLGLALARTGAGDRANAILLRLYREGHADEETLGILARTFKDLWAQGSDPAVQEAHLRSACEFYTRAYRLTAEHGTAGEKNRWTGINAATTALLLGEKDRAAALAREVRTLCLEELKGPGDAGGDTYWIHATLGEAALILGEWAEAEDRYGRAMVEARGRFAYLSSTRRQARLLLEHQGLDGTLLDRCFRIPRVVTFAGHMIDHPGRPIPRFPAGLERPVSDAIAERLEALHAGFGYASAACGSDILFLEAMLERQAEVHVILPYGGEEFVRASVDIIPGAPWAARFERVLARATRVTTATEQRSLGATVTLDYANMLLVGLATIRAQQLGTEPTLLAVWDGRPGDGPGGTATIVRRWRELGHDVEVVDLPGILRSVAPELATPSGAVAAPAPPPAPEASDEFPKHIMAMLFADAVGYSRLAEEEIPRFVRDFLGAVTDLVAASPHAPAMKNTWGDALYCVFARVEDAGRFALDLCDRVCRINWPEKGLPDGLNFRIALHAGPVYSCIDPLTQKLNYIGSHVSRAARIEPITPPGQVYASQAFAALAAAQGITAFAFEYIGQIPLAKNAGTFPMYHLRRPVPP